MSADPPRKAYKYTCNMIRPQIYRYFCENHRLFVFCPLFTILTDLEAPWGSPNLQMYFFTRVTFASVIKERTFLLLVYLDPALYIYMKIMLL